LGNVTDRDIAYWGALGAIFSDIGYLPLGPRQFSDSVHYIGVGLFTDDLTKVICSKHATNPRLLAFAAGIRSHYWADRYGHYQGTNIAVAKLLKKTGSGIRRVVYEDDEATHKLVELGAFSVYDLKYGTTRLAASFINNVSESGLDALITPIEEALRMTYGPGGESMAPTYVQILHYTYQVMAAVCETVNRVYSPSVANNAAFFDVFKACQQKLLSSGAPTDAKPDKGLLSLIEDGVKLSKEPWLVKIYEASVEAVKNALAPQKSGPLPNYNLDTNLPAVSGQYRLADTAYQKLTTPIQTTCEAPAFEAIVNGRAVDWRKYQAGGLCSNTTARKFLRSVSCPALLAGSDLTLLRKGWLMDIDPAVRKPTGISGKCRDRVLLAGMTFRLDKACTIRATKPVSQIDLLYACYAAQMRVQKKSNPSRADTWIEAAHVEALNRLRVYDEIDRSTGLYKIDR